MSGPCNWAVPEGALCSDWGAFTVEERAYALQFATFVVWAATGRQYGLCPVTVRPCKALQEPLYLTYPVLPSWSLWVNSSAAVADAVAPVGCCGGPCSCNDGAIALPGPVGAITAVAIDGAALDPSAYRLYGSRLIRQDGLAWPATQDLRAPAGAVGTWSVAYTRGVAVPGYVLQAAAVYACEIARGRAGGNCLLPNRIQSVTRQGVDIQFVDQADYLDKGRTGVPEVDQILALVNPRGLPNRLRVMSPDLPTFR